MYLKDLKQHIESFQKGYVFKHKLSEPFSWRGYYSEVALLKLESLGEEFIGNIYNFVELMREKNGN